VPAFESTLRQHLTIHLLRIYRSPPRLNYPFRRVDPRAPIAPRLLNRGVQSDQFRLAFVKLSEAQPPFPQLYVLPGPLEEDHAGLIERFKELVIEPYHALKLRDISEVRVYKVEWVEPALATSLLPLLSRLFSAFNAPGYRYASSPDLSPKAFVKLVSSMRTPLVIRHDIGDHHCCRSMSSLIKDYWEYWNEVGRLGADNPVLIFLNFVYLAPESTNAASTGSITRTMLSGVLRAVHKRATLSVSMPLGAQ
jgi:hypothetical protein